MSRPWTPAFIRGDLHIEHVFVDGDKVSGIIDWSEARQGSSRTTMWGQELHVLRTDGLITSNGPNDVVFRAGRAVDEISAVDWLRSGYALLSTLDEPPSQPRAN